jgi:hypothetical protein
MIDAVHEMLAMDSVPVFDQPHTGKTYRSIDYTHDVITAIASDVRFGWIRQAINNQISY